MADSFRKTLFLSRRQNENRDGSNAVKFSMRWSPSVRYATLVAATLVIALLFPRSSLVEYQYEVGSIWSGDTIRAPFAFPLYKDEQTYNRDVEQARSAVLPIFVPSGITATTLQDSIAILSDILFTSEIPPSFLSDKSWQFIQSIPEELRASALGNISRKLIDAATPPYNAGVIDRNKSLIARETIALRRSEVYEEELPINVLYDSLNTLHSVEAAIAGKFSPDESRLAMEMFYHVFVPMYKYSSTLTEESRKRAEESVPKSLGIVSEDELIVATGERITEWTQLKLTSYERSRQLREEEKSPWLELIGNLGHVLILIGLTILYLYNFRPRIFNDNLQLGIIYSTMVLVCFMAYLSLTIDVNLPIEFLVLMPFLSMLLAILFDSRTAFYITVISSLLIAGVRGNDYTLAIACLSAGIMAAYTVRDIKNRTQLFRSIGYSMLGFALAIIALGLERSESLGQLGVELGFASINAIISPVLTFGVIMLIEIAFGVATDLKLLEYDNLNHPLLKALADKAPGTYQHTLTIARLAESAANAIGANALLAKVGSYYHDIGKIAKAEYFVENQMEMGNKHDKIKPEQSAKVIRNHVLDGIEIAKQYKLPQRIADFIPAHHGTTYIQYFLDKARETDPEVDEKSFRYPGPLPHSRETAIVMLADAVEATTRSLPNPKPKAIEETIDRIIKKRFSEGQLDECELTLADFTKIKKAFMKNLIGMSHPRIQYKNTEKGEDVPEPLKQSGKGATKQDGPMIPYIDDAFGPSDTGAYYGKQQPNANNEQEGET